MASKSHGRIWKMDLGLFILGFFYLGYSLLMVSGSYFWVCEFGGSEPQHEILHVIHQLLIWFLVCCSYIA